MAAELGGFNYDFKILTSEIDISTDYRLNKITFILIFINCINIVK